MERKSYDMVDVTKLGMAFLIVAIHCSAGGLNMIGRLGVPSFFIASSYFFFKRYLTQSEKQQKKMTIRYVKRIALRNAQHYS